MRFYWKYSERQEHLNAQVRSPNGTWLVIVDVKDRLNRQGNIWKVYFVNVIVNCI